MLQITVAKPNWISKKNAEFMDQSSDALRRIGKFKIRCTPSVSIYAKGTLTEQVMAFRERKVAA